MLIPKYEVGRTTQYWVLAHFSCTHYVLVWPWPLTYSFQNSVTLPGRLAEYICRICIWNIFTFLKYAATKCRFCASIARQPVLPRQPFYVPQVGGRVMLASKYEFDTITQCWVIALFNWIHFMTLWPWPLTFWPWSLVTWCNCVGIPCAKFEVDTTYRSELGWLEVSIA